MSRGGRPLAVAVILAAGPPGHLAAQCPDGSPPPCARLRTSLDTARYAILPFAHREGSQPAMLDGADCAELLMEAFGRWVDVQLADRTRVYDALQRRGTHAPFRIAFDAGLAIARQLGAGRLVMGHLWIFADTLRLTASVYDAAQRGVPLRQAATRVPVQSAGIGAAFNRLADSLLGATVGPAKGSGAEQTRSLGGLAAYQLGQRAIRSWDLATATRQLRAAVAADSDFAHAYIWLGQAILWAADSTPDAARDRTVIAHRTDDLLDRLGRTDRALLLAQRAMFERRWLDACQQYRDILAADSTHFAAWYGLAECNAGDLTVIRYPRDTTRFTFRGSYETAVQAYRRALLLAPAFNLTFERRAIDRLPRLLLAEWYWREGRLDGSAYVAFPELEADTMAFYAVPGEVAARGYEPPRTHAAAVARNRHILLEVTHSFSDAFPGEPRARRALARALEVTGRLVPGAGEPRSALSELATAQRLERDPRRRARDAADRVRVLLKAGEFAAARRLGDSLLRVAPRPTAGLAGVAVLLGRPGLATRFLAAEDTAWLSRSADNQPTTIPLRAAQAGLALLAYAAVGAPAESLVAYERRVDDLTAGLPSLRRATTRSALLDVPAELAFEVLGPRPAHRDGPPGPRSAMRLQWALGRGDTGVVRAALDSLGRERRGRLSTGESTADGVYLDARLLLAVGDTNLAGQTLDAPLDSLMVLHTLTLRYLPLAGCLVRMMALRANLAAVRGDAPTAQRWARAVVTLWSGADPALQPLVRRMRQIAEPAR